MRDGWSRLKARQKAMGREGKCASEVGLCGRIMGLAAATVGQRRVKVMRWRGYPFACLKPSLEEDGQ